MPNNDIDLEKFDTLSENILGVLTEANQQEINRFKNKFPDVPENKIERILDRAQVRNDVNIFNMDSFEEVHAELLKFSNGETKRIMDTNGFFKPKTGKISEKNLRIIESLLKYAYDDYISGEASEIIPNWNTKRTEGLKTGITEFKSFNDLKTTVLVDDKFKGGDNFDEVPEDDEGNHEIIYSDDELILVKILSYESSVKLCHDQGSTGSWCISFKGTDSSWTRHRDQGNNFIFLIPKNGSKYAINYKDGDVEFINAQDQLEPDPKVIKDYPQIVKPLKALGIDIESLADTQLEETEFETDKGKFKGYKWSKTSQGRSDISGKMTVFMDENFDYLDIEKHNHPGMMIE